MGNWNYSRSLLFALAIPYYHFGVRTSIPIGKYFTGGVQIVNGWNNIGDNNSGKDHRSDRNDHNQEIRLEQYLLCRPETTTPVRDGGHMYDTVVVFTPSTKFNAISISIMAKTRISLSYPGSLYPAFLLSANGTA